MAIELEYPALNEDGSSSPRQTAIVVNNLVAGKQNNRLDLELTLNSATTVVNDFRLGPESGLDLMPMDSNAANEFYWFSGQGDGVVTINHSNNALVRAFRLIITG